MAKLQGGVLAMQRGCSVLMMLQQEQQEGEARQTQQERATAARGRERRHGARDKRADQVYAVV